MEMKAKRKFRPLIIVRNILLTVIALILVWIVFHHALKVYEQTKFPAIGQKVEVDNQNMHVYTRGDGENTIVLLSGLGTTAPVLDFEPLITEMANSNKVVVVESFGYGWSDITTKKRTVENIVEEIRTALKKANIVGPYILMPHSVSGIYSMYFANKYPAEIKAVIGVDALFPQALAYFNEPAPTLPEFLRYMAPIGIARLALYANPEGFLPISEGNTYSERNLKMTKAISAWKGGNKNVVNEANEIKYNIDKTVDMTFPSLMPVLLFTPKTEKVTENEKNQVTFYQTQLSKSPSSKIVTLEGHHYLHWTRYKEMSQQVNKFIDSLTN